jgi:hypothetical protein
MKLQMFTRIRHSGAPRSGEPGIYNHRSGLWIPGSQPSASPRNDADMIRTLETLIQRLRELACAVYRNDHRYER